MSNSNPQQGSTVEDKLTNIELHKILNRVFVPNPDWKKNKVALKRREFRMRQIKDLQAIITTETTKELEIIKQRLPSPDNNIEEWRGHNLGLSQAIAVLDSEIDRLAALQKEQNK